MAVPTVTGAAAILIVVTVLPFGRLSGRHGTCGLCGFVGKLSKTHIPARASGNTSPSRAAVERIDASGVPLIDLGRPRDGGLFGWWLCEACNGRTGQWDEEYVRWASPLALALQEGKHRARRPLACMIETGDPGAFVRALWGWMFAVDDELRAEQPAVAQSVLSAEPVEAPTAVRLLLGATTSLRVWLRGQRDHVSVTTRLAASEGRTHPSGLWTPTPEVVPLPRAVVCAPPYVAILAAATDDPVAPYMDTAGWLADRSGYRRRVALYLPTITALENNPSPTPVTYRQLVA